MKSINYTLSASRNGLSAKELHDDHDDHDHDHYEDRKGGEDNLYMGSNK